MQRVQHHLVNLRDPEHEYTAGEFFRDALRSISEVLERGRTPVLCGGTSMYLRWLVQGRPEAPKSDPALAESVRQRLAPFEAMGDWPSGLALLEHVDPGRAAQLTRNDWYRLHRALVVAEQTERPVAELPPQEDVDGLDAFRASLDMRCFFLSAPRIPLCRRIDERCEAMLQAGLFEEVSSQLEQLRLLPSCPAGRAIGYRQTMAYMLRKPCRRGDSTALKEYVEGFTAASRRYAAQQTKWFRSEPQFEWVAADWDQPARVVEAVAARIALDRADFDKGLATPEQVALRAIKPEEGKAMRLYAPQLRCLGERMVLDDILERADTCCDRLQPHMAQIDAADIELSKRFPWKREAGGGDDSSTKRGQEGAARSSSSSGAPEPLAPPEGQAPAERGPEVEAARASARS